MKILAKILSVFINLANYGVGIAVALILVFKWDYVSVFYFGNMTSNESLFVNMIMFQAALLLIGIVMCLLVDEYDPKYIELQFPTVFILLPVLVGIVSIYYAFTGETLVEKLVVIGCAVLYVALSFGIITTGSKIFQLYPNKK